jgi:Ca2+:H+ antiporter
MTLSIQNGLLLFIPAAIVLGATGADPILIFLTSALAIVPLAGLMGDATESLADSLGPTAGGLLNATLGNAPEIIIGLFALQEGLTDIVKSSITGSIIGNLLLGLGISMFVGGVAVRRPKQSFDSSIGRMHGSLLMLAGFGLLIPAVYGVSARADREISLEIAAILFVVYLASLVYTLVTRRSVVGKEAVKEDLRDEQRDRSRLSPGQEQEIAEKRTETSENGTWSRRRAFSTLAAVGVGLAIMSELLTDAIDPAARSLGLTPRFAGVFLLAVVGNAAELVNAARFARRDQMDLAIGITVGASTQVALLVAPVLVFAGVCFGEEMNLLFSPFELVAIGLAIIVTRSLLYDGSSSWLEGLMLVAVYLMLGLGFYYLPIEGGTPTLLHRHR